MPSENGRTLADLFAETREELKEFVQTRLDMLKAEVREKLAAWKVALPLIAIALVLGLTAWLVLTACLIAAIAVAFDGSPWAYTFATLIVGAAYLLVSVIVAAFALRGLKKQGVTPRRTFRILQQDRAWLSSEMRGQI